MPIGLLTSIAESFSISESTVGIMITVYSWSVMILSLPLMVFASKFDYRRVLLVTLAVFAIVLVLLKPSAISLITLLIVCACWGCTSSAFNVTAQSEVIIHGKESSTVAMSIFLGIFNLGIGLGSFIGGQTVNILGISYIGFVGAFIGLVGGIVCIISAK